ncbi:MAG: 16S rRNA processing protein RimM [Bacteroidetes bacterium]|nr:16S rRNA processing protein RimM [Bacteroidota bacterium]
MKGYFQIGHIAKLHGFKGEVSLFLDVTQPDNYRSLNVIFFEIEGIATPFPIQSVKPMINGFMVLKLEGVNSEAEARRLVRKSVFLSDSLLPVLDEHSFYDHEIVGFTVIDAVRGNIGTAIGVIDHPSNPLLQVDKEGVEILIPLNLELYKKVNRTEKTLTLTTPEGLLEVYLT